VLLGDLLGQRRLGIHNTEGHRWSCEPEPLQPATDRGGWRWFEDLTRTNVHRLMPVAVGGG
jgi:hypothetical protein